VSCDIATGIDARFQVFTAVSMKALIIGCKVVLHSG
jgi:hypothetical protein